MQFVIPFWKLIWRSRHKIQRWFKKITESKGIYFVKWRECVFPCAGDDNAFPLFGKTQVFPSAKQTPSLFRSTGLSNSTDSLINVPTSDGPLNAVLVPIDPKQSSIQSAKMLWVTDQNTLICELNTPIFQLRNDKEQKRYFIRKCRWVRVWNTLKLFWKQSCQINVKFSWAFERVSFPICILSTLFPAPYTYLHHFECRRREHRSHSSECPRNRIGSISTQHQNHLPVQCRCASMKMTLQWIDTTAVRQCLRLTLVLNMYCGKVQSSKWDTKYGYSQCTCKPWDNLDIKSIKKCKTKIWTSSTHIRERNGTNWHNNKRGKYTLTFHIRETLHNIVYIFGAIWLAKRRHQNFVVNFDINVPCCEELFIVEHCST